MRPKLTSRTGTHQRRPLFDREPTRVFLRTAIQTIRRKRPFDLVATVLLPDHWHCVWTLPEGDADYSTRWRQIKEEFTRAYLAAGGVEGPQGLRSTDRPYSSRPVDLVKG